MLIQQQTNAYDNFVSWLGEKMHDNLAGVHCMQYMNRYPIIPNACIVAYIHNHQHVEQYS